MTVLDAALAQVPARLLRARDEHGRVPVLVRTDAAGATQMFAQHLAVTGVEFSLGANLGHFDTHTALAALPAPAWTPPYQARKPRAGETGVQIEPRDGAWVAEATGLVELSAWPPGTRLILRKERPHPARSYAPRGRAFHERSVQWNARRSTPRRSDVSLLWGRPGSDVSMTPSPQSSSLRTLWALHSAASSHDVWNRRQAPGLG